MMKPIYQRKSSQSTNLPVSMSDSFRERFKSRISIVSGSGEQKQIRMSSSSSRACSGTHSRSQKEYLNGDLPMDLSKWTVTDLRSFFEREKDTPYHVMADDGKTILRSLTLDGLEIQKKSLRKLPDLKESRLPKLSSRSSSIDVSFMYKDQNIPYSKKPQFVDYQPYTLKDSETFRPPQKLGGLGANLDTEEYLSKLKKRIKQVEYANAVRLSQSQHLGGRASKNRERNSLSSMSLPDPTEKETKILRTKTTANDIEEASVKRERMLKYGKSVPKPKIKSISNYNSIGLYLPPINTKTSRLQNDVDPIMDKILALTETHDRNKSIAQSIKSSLHL